jgi:predicted regulator of Ras-like GTPase activity (Roadblock/LC7/MglB family)
MLQQITQDENALYAIETAIVSWSRTVVVTMNENTQDLRLAGEYRYTTCYGLDTEAISALMNNADAPSTKFREH